MMAFLEFAAVFREIMRADPAHDFDRGLRCVDQLSSNPQCGDGELGLIADRGAVAGVDAHAVDPELSRRPHQ